MCGAVKPYVQPQVPLQRRGDKKWRLRFADEQKERDWRCVCLLMRRHLCVIPRPNCRNDVIWTYAGCPFCLRQRVWCFLSFFSETLTASLYVSILESTVLPAARGWFGGEHWTYLQDSDLKHTTKFDVRLVACQCARIYYTGAVATAVTRPQPSRTTLGHWLRSKPRFASQRHSRS